MSEFVSGYFKTKKKFLFPLSSRGGGVRGKALKKNLFLRLPLQSQNCPSFGCVAILPVFEPGINIYNLNTGELLSNLA